MRLAAPFILFTLACALPAGCAEGTTLAGDVPIVEMVRPDVPGDPAVEPAVDVPADTQPDSAGCAQTISAFVAYEQEAYYYDDGIDMAWLYLAPDADIEAGAFDYIAIELWPSYGGPSSPGTYTFTDANYSTCGLCGLYESGCVYDGVSTTCGKTYLLTGGTLTLSQLGMVGGSFSGSAVSLRGTEVTIDPSTYVSTPVAGAGALCIGSAAISASVVEYPVE
jgi:hypothetical protein